MAASEQPPSTPFTPTLQISLCPPTPANDGRFGLEGLPSQTRRYPSPSLSHWTSRQGEDVGDLGSSSYSWSTAPSVLSTLILACEDDCTAHSGDVHDAVRMLRAYRSVANNPLPSPGNWSPGVSGWPMTSQPPGGGYWPMASPVQELAQLPVPPTLQNSELLTTCTSCVVIPFLSSAMLLTCLPIRREAHLAVQGVLGREPRGLEPLHQVPCSLLCPVSTSRARRDLHSGMLSQRHRPS